MTPSQSNTDKGDILIVDDVLPNLRILFNLLEQHGYEVRGAANGPTTLMMAQAAPPDLILLDVRMPDMDGYEVSRRLKADPRTQNIPILFISALDKPDNIIKGFKSGSVDYITKPFHVEEVLSRVETHVNLHRLTRQLARQNRRLQQEVSDREKAEHALQELNQALEQRVKERTTDLQASNHRLQNEMEGREHIETALRLSEERYRAIFEQAAEAIVIIDINAGHIVHFNNRACHSLGYTRQQFQTLVLADLGAPNNASEIEAHVQQVKTSGENSIETVFRRRDEETIVCLVSSRLITLDNKQFIQSIWNDISERKQAELLLQIQRDLAVALSASSGLENSLHKILDITLRVESIDCGGIYLVDEEENLILKAHAGLSETFAKRIAFYSAATPQHQLIREGQPIYSRYEALPHPEDLKADLEATAVLPIQFEGKIVAALNLGSRSHTHIPTRTKQIIEMIAAQLGGAIARVRAEENLHLKDAAIAAAISAIAIADLSGNLTYVNDAFLRMWGYDAFDQIANKSVLSFWHNREEATAVVQSLHQHGNWVGELVAQRRDGSLFDTQVSAGTVPDQTSGEPRYMMASFADITERKEAEKSLRLRNRELTLLNRAGQAINASLDLDQVLINMLEETRHLLNVLACSVWLTDDDTGELICRQATGPRKHLLRGWRLRPGQGIAGWAARHNRSLITPDCTRDERYIPAVAQAVNLEIHAMLTVPLRIKGNVIGIFQIVDDATDRFTPHDLQLAESLASVAANAIENARLHADLQSQLTMLQSAKDRLVQSEKLAAIGELVAGVAHELNNPLSALILYSQLLQRKGISSEFTRDLDKIVHQAQRAGNIVRGLLDFARQHTPEQKVTQINDVLSSTLELLSYEFRTHHVTWNLQADPALPFTLVDPYQLQQVLVNLINNALQAMNNANGGGTLTLSSAIGPSLYLDPGLSREEMIRIIIEDDGPGIPSDILSRIFDPFFTTKPAGEGTGLGLSVCHGIITEQGGYIWADGREGKGATFFIELPVEMPEEEQTASMTGPLPGLGTEAADAMRILVIDDEPSVLKVVMQILQRRGFQVDGANSGHSGLQRLSRYDYDLILSDMRMPGLSGADFYRRVEKRFPHMADRIIFCTGDTLNRGTRAFLKEVALPCLSKPFELEELETTIQDRLAFLSKPTAVPPT